MNVIDTELGKDFVFWPDAEYRQSGLFHRAIEDRQMLTDLFEVTPGAWEKFIVRLGREVK